MWAILVTNEQSLIREHKMGSVIEDNYVPILPKKPYFIGFGTSASTRKFPKFLNWYDDIEYCFTWENKRDSEEWLNKTMAEAELFYNTNKDPFYHLRKTKGDWKNYLFIIVNISHLL